jgi:hypothetical protein
MLSADPCKCLSRAKACGNCKTVKPEAAFSLTRTRRHLDTDCRKCKTARAAQWNRDHPEKRRATRRKWRLNVVHGLTDQQYNDILTKQGGVCAICGIAGSSPTGQLYRLGVDHDHETGENRGLLCTPCNRALGLLSDDPVRVLRAFRYLKTASTGTFGTKGQRQSNYRSRRRDKPELLFKDIFSPHPTT